MSTLPGTELVAGPADVTVGELPTTYVVLTVRQDIACDPAQFYLWSGEDGRPRSATALGDSIRVWIVDYRRFAIRIVIEAETRNGAGPAIDREIEQIIDSIAFGG